MNTIFRLTGFVRYYNFIIIDVLKCDIISSGKADGWQEENNGGIISKTKDAIYYEDTF